MSVLVTGGAGYIGSHMVLALLDAGEDVIVVDNLSTGFRWAVPEKARLAVGGVGDQALVGGLIAAHRVNGAIHFAGSIVVPDSIADPLGYYLNNTLKSRSLLECAVAGGVEHFIFSSTAAVYGMPAHNPVLEDAPINPISPYGSSKMMTEMMLRDMANAHGLSYVALRYFKVAGADPQGRSGQSTPDATHLIKVAAQAALGQRPCLEVFGSDYPTPDGTCIRDYIHVTDLVDAHVKALQYLEEGGKSQVLNCGYGHGFSVKEILETVQKVAKLRLNIRLGDRRPGDPPELIADPSNIKKVLDWYPAHDDLREIIDSALCWERRP
jgi:UDP-glucose 4-epimerase